MGEMTAVMHPTIIIIEIRSMIQSGMGVNFGIDLPPMLSSPNI
jgi:hypothetical protein